MKLIAAITTLLVAASGVAAGAPLEIYAQRCAKYPLLPEVVTLETTGAGTLLWNSSPVDMGTFEAHLKDTSARVVKGSAFEFHVNEHGIKPAVLKALKRYGFIHHCEHPVPMDDRRY